MLGRMNAVAPVVLALVLAGGCAARTAPILRAAPPAKQPAEDPRLRQVCQFLQRAPAEAMVMSVREPGKLAEFIGGRTFSQDDKQSCFSGGGRLVCGKKSADLVAYLDGARPARSAWSALDSAG